MMSETNINRRLNPLLLRSLGKCYERLALMVENGEGEDNIELSSDIMSLLRRAEKLDRNKHKNRVVKLFKEN